MPSGPERRPPSFQFLVQRMPTERLRCRRQPILLFAEGSPADERRLYARLDLLRHQVGRAHGRVRLTSVAPSIPEVMNMPIRVPRDARLACALALLVTACSSSGG